LKFLTIQKSRLNSKSKGTALKKSETSATNLDCIHALTGSFDFALNKLSRAAEVAAATTRRHKIRYATRVCPCCRVYAREKFLSESLHFNKAQADDGRLAVPLKRGLRQRFELDRHQHYAGKDVASTCSSCFSPATKPTASATTFFKAPALMHM
jgi:hypothetical protein